MANKKSAKDLAFDKERAKYRRQMRELEHTVQAKQTEINALTEKLRETEQTMREKDDWIERLLTYMDLSEEDLRTFIENEKRLAEANKTWDSIKSLMSVFHPFLGNN